MNGNFDLSSTWLNSELTFLLKNQIQTKQGLIKLRLLKLHTKTEWNVLFYIFLPLVYPLQKENPFIIQVALLSYYLSSWSQFHTGTYIKIIFIPTSTHHGRGHKRSKIKWEIWIYIKLSQRTYSNLYVSYSFYHLCSNLIIY